MKKSFILYSDTEDILNELSNEQAGIVFKNIFKYVNDRDTDSMDLACRIVFKQISMQLDRDNEKYEQIKAKRSNAGAMGGRGNKKQEEANKANAFFDKQIEANKAVNVTVTENVTVNDTDNVIVNEKENICLEFSNENLNARILELENENQLLKEKREKEKSSAKKEKEVKFDFKQALINEGVEESIASDFMLVRKGKKAPSTETAFKLILNECEENQFSMNEAIKTCINKNWQSFKYEWYINLNSNGHSNNNYATGQPSIGTPQRSNLFGKDGKSANRLVEIGKRTPISELRRKTTFEVCEQ